MAHTVATQYTTPADALRTHLDALERLAVKPNPASVEELLVTLDAAEAELDLLESTEMDMRAERARWENLLRRLDSQPQLIASAAAGRPGGMNALRATHNRAGDNVSFWWQADRTRADRQRRSLIRALAILAIAAVALFGGYALFNMLFPPDPAAVAFVQASGAIERLADAGDWQAALATAEEATAVNKDPQLLVLGAAVAERALNEPRAAQLREEARTGISDDLMYWIALGNARLRVYNPEGAQAAADAALAIAPDDAEVALLLGRVAMDRGDRETALDELDRAYQLAVDNQPQIAVSARVMYAELMRQLELPPLETATPAP